MNVDSVIESNHLDLVTDKRVPVLLVLVPMTLLMQPTTAATDRVLVEDQLQCCFIGA